MQPPQHQPLPFTINIKASITAQDEANAAHRAPAAACIAVKVAQTLAAFPQASNRAININVELCKAQTGMTDTTGNAPTSTSPLPSSGYQPAQALQNVLAQPAIPVPQRPQTVLSATSPEHRMRILHALRNLPPNRQSEALTRVWDAQRQKEDQLARQRQLQVEQWRQAQAQAKAGMDEDEDDATNPEDVPASASDRRSSPSSLEVQQRRPVTRSAKRRAASHPPPQRKRMKRER